MDAKSHNSAWKLQRRKFTPLPGSILCLLTVLGLAAAQAQLAITEVMSSATTNLGPNLVRARPDFWELTNFGTNSLSLDGYSFSDLGGWVDRVDAPFSGCSVGPGESIIFVKTDTRTMMSPADFMNWWGANNLPSGLQVRLYGISPGLSSEVDAVQLFNPSGDLVDRVDFGRALQGHAFVNDPLTGEFGNFSNLGADGAFKATLTDDVGSPGVTTGPVPLSILEQPASITQDAGSDVEFSVRAIGLPHPSYQWFFNGAPLADARTARLILAEVQPDDAGDYVVWISNGLASVQSSVATLLVNTNHSPAMIVAGPSDAIVFEGQTATFIVKTRGFPTPILQWQTNGVNVPGATNHTFVVAMADLALSGTICSVRVENDYASTNASAQLTVTRPPHFAITEVMAFAAGTNSEHGDWFELTNLDTNAVNLLGYRFADRYSFDSSFRITNSLVVEPGESIIFAERMTPEQFIDWWGQDRLPPGLKITTFRGFGLKSEGDEILFWNSAETDPYAPVASAGFLQSLQGISQRFIPPDYYFVEDSALGLDGAFRAVNQGDIGSPGYINNPPARFLSVTAGQEGVVLKCRVIDGKQYTLQYKARLEDPYWNSVGTYSADDAVLTINQPFLDASQGFFLLMEAQ